MKTSISHRFISIIFGSDKKFWWQLLSIFFALILLIVAPIAIVHYFGYEPIYELYLWKTNHFAPYFSEISTPFYLGYALLMATILLILTIIILDPRTSISRWNENRLLGSFSIIISLLFLGIFLIYGPVNTETYTNEITSGLIRIRHYFSGQILTWYDGRGFGTPFPTVQAPDTHPLFFFWGIIPPRVLLSLLWTVHLTVGCFFFLKICRLLRLKNTISLICGFCYVFSMPTILGTIYDNFTTIFIAWTMYPVIVYLVFRIFFDSKKKLDYPVFLLPLLLAFTSFNSLPSSSSHVLVVLAIGVVFGCMHDRNIYVIRNFIVVFILACILVSPNVFYIVRELSFFPEDVVGGHAQAATNWKMILRENALPLAPKSVLEFLQGNVDFSFKGLFDNGFSRLLFHNPRQPFLGGVYLLLAVIGVGIVIRGAKKIKTKQDHAVRIVVSSCFIIGLVGSTLPRTSPFFFDLVSPGSMNQEMILFGILSSGIALDSLERGWLRNFRGFTLSLLAFQSFQVLAYTAFVVFFYSGNPFNTHANFFESPKSGNELYEWLIENKKRYGDRVLLSPMIEVDLQKETAVLEAERFYSIPDINMHTGINVVNDMLKGISMDRIQSSLIYTHGNINSNYDLLNNRDLLNVLGINWILVKDNERNRLDQGLIARDEFVFSWQNERWILYHLKDAWAKVFAMSNEAFDLKPIYRPECGHTGLLCVNISPYLSYQKNVPITVSASHGHREISFEPQNEDFILGLSTLYRPEWTATMINGESLHIEPLFDAFIGIEIPAGVSSVSLYFIPKTRIGLAYLSFLCFLLCAAYLSYLSIKSLGYRKG